MIQRNRLAAVQALVIPLAVTMGLIQGAPASATPTGTKTPGPVGAIATRASVIPSAATVPSRPGVVRNGTWLLRSSLSQGPNTVPAFVFGRPDDIPVMGDWNGDGTKTAGVVRIIGTSTLSYQWFLRNSNTAGPADIAPFIYGRPSFGFEEPGDFPVTGDWNGDGVDTPGAVRFRNGTTLAGWLLRNSNTGGVANLSFGYGRISDGPPVPGDWNGDGIDTPGIIRGFGQGAFSWLLRNSNTAGAANISAVFGSGLDEPIVGDWDGDGDDGLGVTKQVSTGLGWSLRNTPTTGTVNRSFVYGRSEDLPVIW